METYSHQRFMEARAKPEEEVNFMLTLPAIS
jgi:hypothetical protein